jgi:hypothetical protein
MLAFTCFSTTARLTVWLFSSAPTGHDTIAQGNALGPVSEKIPSPEWAAQPMFRPFRAE